jgi:Na+/melibiose symporter-like transporter
VVGLALAAFAIVETPTWGWASARFVLCALGAVALVGVFVWRCARVPNPLLDLRLFEARNFRWANAGTLVYATGFNAMFLGNVLFLTRVWHYSIMRAGLAIAIGPLIVACTAPFFGRLAGRIGQRRLLIPGGLVWASGGLVLLARITTTPSYVTHYLPAIVLTALGVSLAAQLSSAAVQGAAGSLGSGSASTRPCATSAPRWASPSSRSRATSPRRPRSTASDGWWLLVASG